MKKSNIGKLTGYFGIGIFILNIIVIPLYFIYDGPPPVWNILTRSIINIFSCVVIIAFVSGLQNVITKIDSNNAFLGTFISLTGLAYAIVLIVAESIQLGSVWANINPIDPTVVGNGGEGALLIYGPIDRVLTAVFLIAVGTAIIKINITPKWIGWLAYFVSLYQLAFVPTIFFMSQPTNFYSTNGWNIPIAGGLFIFWILIVSIFLIIKKSEK
ncbi:MAG: hypothetical protein U0W24_21355 [Bacteroidales bacterium]